MPAMVATIPRDERSAPDSTCSPAQFCDEAAIGADDQARSGVVDPLEISQEVLPGDGFGRPGARAIAPGPSWLRTPVGSLLPSSA
jgi:hypothetical protein